MLRVDPTGYIQINRGDNGEVSLFINQGTPLNPVQYSFYYELKLKPSLNIAEYDIQLDTDIWRNKVFTDGVYVFTWIYDDKIETKYWSLNGERVDINDYGIFPQGMLYNKVPLGATITVTYILDKHLEEIYFYVWQPLQQMGQTPVLKKTIRVYNDLVTVEKDGKFFYEETVNCMDADNNIVIYFNPQDTLEIPPGEYRYQIIAKVFDRFKNKYNINTITNRTPLYVVDDDYSDRKW